MLLYATKRASGREQAALLCAAARAAWRHIGAYSAEVRFVEIELFDSADPIVTSGFRLDEAATWGWGPIKISRRSDHLVAEAASEEELCHLLELRLAGRLTILPPTGATIEVRSDKDHGESVTLEVDSTFDCVELRSQSTRRDTLIGHLEAEVGRVAAEQQIDVLWS